MAPELVAGWLSAETGNKEEPLVRSENNLFFRLEKFGSGGKENGKW